MRVQILPQEGKSCCGQKCASLAWNAMARKLSIPLVKIPDHTEPHDHIWSRVREEVGGKR